MLLLRNEDFDQAVMQFDSALMAQPNSPAAKFGRAEVNFLLGRRDEALSGYLEVINSPESGQYAKAIAERIGAPYAIRPITTAPGENMMARFSADGRAIVFQSTRNGNWEIYRADADGSAPVRLTNDPAVDESPCFSPDGRWVAFVRASEKAAREIFMMDALFGADLICISRHRADDWNPAFSPKGNQLAFVSDRDDVRAVELHERQSDIFLFSLTDSSLTRFTQGFGAKAAPCFTPDGGSLVYVNNVNGMFDIFEQRLGTASPVSLIAKAGPKGGPQFSPNRKQVVYFEKRDNNLDLFLFDRDKNSVQRLTCDPGVDAFPTFSPDGNQIYFTSNRGGNYQIYALDLRAPVSRTELTETLRRLLEPVKTAAQ
jgi:TolB protein